MQRGDRSFTAYAVGAKTTFILGECPLPTRGGSPATSTTLSADQTICVPAQMQQIPTVSPLVAIVLFSTSSTKSLLTSIEASMVGGTTWTCSRSALAA